MKKFLMHQYVRRLSFPDEWEIVTDNLNASVKGSLKDTGKVNVLELIKLVICLKHLLRCPMKSTSNCSHLYVNRFCQQMTLIGC